MRIPGIKTLRTFSRWLRARTFGGALILGYHRITPTQGGFPETCVSPENFAEHLRELRKNTRPIHLSNLVQHLRDGSLPEKSIAITFDDGYADNLYTAKPLLEKYDIPATIFVCSGYTGREFWWDELDRLVMSSNAELSALRLELGINPFLWHQPDGTRDSDSRRRFWQALYRFLLMLDVEDQNHAMDVIRKWSGLASVKTCTLRAMTEAELLQLADGGLIEIGAHTRHHPMLPRLSLERQKKEIETNKRELEMWLERRIAGFAYPNGQLTEETKQIVREMGFSYACTSLHDVVRPESDMFALTRFWQKDVDGDRFSKALNRWMSMDPRR